MCGTVMRGADALPGSKATSRAKGSHRNLGGLGSGRQMLRERDGPHREGEEPKPMMRCSEQLRPRARRSSAAGGARRASRRARASPPASSQARDVGDGLGDRAAAQARGLRALGADAATCPRTVRAATAAARSTARPRPPRAVVRDPAQVGVAGGSSSSRIVVCPIGPVPLNAPATRCSARSSRKRGEVARVDDLHRPVGIARARARRRPRVIRRTHHGSRKTLSCGPTIRPARTTAPVRAARRRSAAALSGP